MTVLIDECLLPRAHHVHDELKSQLVKIDSPQDNEIAAPFAR